MIIDKPSKVKLYMDGKEIGYAESTITAPTLIAEKPSGSYSLTWKMSEEELDKLHWEISRPKRIRKYVRQIFRL